MGVFKLGYFVIHLNHFLLLVLFLHFISFLQLKDEKSILQPILILLSYLRLHRLFDYLWENLELSFHNQFHFKCYFLQLHCGSFFKIKHLQLYSLHMFHFHLLKILQVTYSKQLVLFSLFSTCYHLIEDLLIPNCLQVLKLLQFLHSLCQILIVRFSLLLIY